ncbi:fused MFS/spermidine synthase [Roseateles chitinivorans]|uniref:fused MFS/spermidine synthase n=1 Tax=Roseateles chitinivorans TaxID=2917965 RepID=UPI003D67265B
MSPPPSGASADASAVGSATAATRQRAGGVALALMGLSGFAGLGYQMVWTQQCALWLGFEAAAVLAVITAFFGGLALGAIAFGGRIERSASPLRWYIACEAAIGLWGLALIVLMQPTGDAVEHWIGAEPAAWWQWTVTFGASFLLLLPATAAMGATLPAIERIVGAEGKRSIAGLYAANTLGAVLGVLLATFWLVPAFGLAATAGVCVGMNALCAVGAWKRLNSERPSAALHDAWRLPSGTSTHRSGPASARWPRAMALMPLALSGMLGIGYEVVVVRVLSQLNEDTVYTFALLLAVYLVGTSLGAAGYQRWWRRWGKRQEEDRLSSLLPGVLGATCLIGLAALWAAPALKNGAMNTLGTGFAAALGAEALLAVAAFGLPTLAMGAWFSHLSAQAMGQGIAFGRALAVNTLGAAMAAPLFGVVVTPWIGPKAALLLIAGGYLAAAAAVAGSKTWRHPTASPTPMPTPMTVATTAFVTIVLALMTVFGAPLAFVDVPDGARLVSYAEGSMASVSVVEDGAGVSRLRINNRQQEGSSASLFVDGRQALLPVLLHPVPRRALFLGLGTGATSGVAAQDPTLQVDAVELLPEVIDASPLFTRALGLDGAMPRLVAADARRFVRASETRYDVIVSDNFHPARSGSGALYTREHFAAVRERLAPQGLFCQWLPLHQLDLDSLRSVTRAFVSVYPDAIAVLAANSLETPVIGLVGRRDTETSTSSTLASWHTRVERAPARRDGRSLADFGLDDEFALLGSVVAGPGSLAAFAGQVPMNTDDRPIVAYLAPRLVYAPTSTPKERLFEFLHRVSASPSDIGVQSPGDSRRLAAYWQARDRFLEAGRSARPVADPAVMLAQVGGPLLEAVRLSPDFRPAYDPLLQMAVALAPRDAATARRVLTALRDAQPARPEAAQALQAMGQ